MTFWFYRDRKFGFSRDEWLDKKEGGGQSEEAWPTAQWKA